MGKKYIIELEDEPFEDIDAERLWRVKGFKSLVFDENGLEILSSYKEPETEREAAQKAWELARELVCIMNKKEFSKYFDVDYEKRTDILYMPYHVIKDSYEERKKINSEIKVGDEVSDCTGTGVVVEISEDCLRILYSNGASYLMSNKEFKKTGRHFPEVAELLKKIGGE